jgi:hypothetical protein
MRRFLLPGLLLLAASCFADTTALQSTPAPQPATTVAPAVIPAATTAPAASTPTAAPAPAPKVLNQATVVVADQSATALQLGIQAAFSEVMIKMSGNPQIMHVPTVQTVATNLSDVVQSYSYVQPKTTAPTGSAPLMLNVVFNQTALQELIGVVNKLNQNTVTTNTNASVKLLITGIKNMNDYTLLMQTLHETAGISDISVDSVDPDRITLNVHLTADLASFENTLNNDHRFKSLMTNTSGGEAQLFYLWTGSPV